MSCHRPPEYTEFEAQIDEVWTDEALDCLVVQAKASTDNYQGTIGVFIDVAKACGEDAWVLWPGSGIPVERVTDGELVPLGWRVDQAFGESAGDGDVELQVLFASEMPSDDAQLSDYSPRTRVAYSYSGTPYDSSEYECNDGFYLGCATTGSGSDAPAGPLTLLVIGLVGVVLGRRVRR